MIISGRAIDKGFFATIYTIVALIALWGAGRIADYAGDNAFYNDYLLPWEAALTAMRYHSGIEPECGARDPMRCMAELMAEMRRIGAPPPRSNTDRPDTFRLGRFGAREHSILLRYERGRITLFGLSPETFERLDRLVDGRHNSREGRFTGDRGSDGISFIAYWRI